MSFADIEDRATAAVFGRLVNAQASFLHAGAGAPVVGNVVFDAAMSVVDDYGVVSSRPALLMVPSVAPLTAEGDTVDVSSLTDPPVSYGSYVVRAVLPQAEGGMQRVALAKV